MTDLNDLPTGIPSADFLAQLSEPTPKHSVAPPPNFSGMTLMSQDEQRAMRSVGQHPRKPAIPTGVVLPASTRAPIENYDVKLSAYEDAVVELQQVKDQQAAAEQKLRLARIEAASNDRPMPERKPDDLSRRIADAEDVVAARLVAVNAAARQVEQALRAAAGEMHVNAEAQFIHDRDDANEKRAAYEVAQAVAVESARTLAHVARVYLAPRVDADVICYRKADIAERSSAEGRWLKEILQNAADEHVSRALPLQLDQARRWLEGGPETLDALVRAYLQPYLDDETPATTETPTETPSEPKPKGKAKPGPEGIIGVDA